MNCPRCGSPDVTHKDSPVNDKLFRTILSCNKCRYQVFNELMTQEIRNTQRRIENLNRRLSTSRSKKKIQAAIEKNEQYLAELKLKVGL